MQSQNKSFPLLKISQLVGVKQMYKVILFCCFYDESKK